MIAVALAKVLAIMPYTATLEGPWVKPAELHCPSRWTDLKPGNLTSLCDAVQYTDPTVCRQRNVLKTSLYVGY